MANPKERTIKTGRNILIGGILIYIFAMPVKMFAEIDEPWPQSPIIGININPIAYNPPYLDPPGKVDFYKASGNSFCCMVGYAFDVNYILQDPSALTPKDAFIKCRVESDTSESGWPVMYYQYINQSQPPWNIPWGYMTFNYDYADKIGGPDYRDDFYEIKVSPNKSGNILVIYQGVQNAGYPKLGIPRGAYPPSQDYHYNILISFPSTDYTRNRVKFQVGLPHSSNPNDDAYGYNLAKLFYIETAYETPYVSTDSGLLGESTSGVYIGYPPAHKPWWWDYRHPSGSSISETASQMGPRISSVLASNISKENDKGFVQKGFARVITYDNNKAFETTDEQEYIRPPINDQNLQDVNGCIVTIPTSIGDINIAYQYCLYYDRYNSNDPCSNPMDWVIEKVTKGVPMPHTDTSDFSTCDYYIMQWKMVLPLNCRPVDSFTIWQPYSTSIFVKKYAENNGLVYYISNPLMPTMYQEMAGTYIGDGNTYSLLPQDSIEPNNIKIYYQGYYHPYDLTAEGIINLKDFALLAKDYKFSSSNDLDGDGIITLSDIGLLLGYYLDDSRWDSFLNAGPQGDFDHDNKVNFIDFAKMAGLWRNGSLVETNMDDLEALCDNWLYGVN